MASHRGIAGLSSRSMRVVPLPPAKVYAPCFRTKLRIARKMATRCALVGWPRGVTGIGHHVLDLDLNPPERTRAAPDGALDGSLDLARAAAHRRFNRFRQLYRVNA
jgi:hypothetical protein